MKQSDARLLVVDDLPSMRRSISTLLRALGFGAIDLAEDGLDALARFQRAPYDLVITDWNMPRATGVDLLRAIRATPAHSQTPVVMLSGTLTAERMVEAVEAGANAFVAKPFLFPSLGDKVLDLVARLAPVTELGRQPPEACG